jgi:hypothetical protein
MPLALVCVAFLLTACWRLALTLGLDGAADTAAATVLLWISAQVGLVLILGVSHLLTTDWLVAATAVVGVATWLYSLLGRNVRRTRRARAAFLGGLRAGGRALRRHPTLLVLLVLVVVEYAYRAGIGLRLPTLDYDGLWYHLTTVDVWRQHHALTQVPEVVWSSADPADSEATTAYTSILAGSNGLANVVQFLYAALGCLAVAALCRRAGVTVRSSLLAGLLVLATPIVFVLAPLAHVDLAAGMDVLAAWHFVLAAFRRPGGGPRFSGAHLLLAGAGAGLAVGTKESGAAFVGFLALVTLIAMLTLRRHRVASVRFAWLSFGGACVLTVGLGGWMYIRNLVAHGNPLWPLAEIGLPGLPGAVGYLTGSPFGPRNITHQNLLVALWRSWSHDFTWHNYHYSRSLGGFGMQFLLIMGPASLAAVVLLLRRRRNWLAYGFLLPGLLLVLAVPKDWQARYVLYICGVAAFGLAVTLDALPRRIRGGVHLLLLAATTFSLVSATWLANYFISNQTKNAYQTVRLFAQPAAVRDALSYWSFDPNAAKLRSGACIVVPPSVQQDYSAPIFFQVLVGSSFNRRLVAAGPEPTDAVQAASLIRANRCRYLVAVIATPLGRALGAHSRPLIRLGSAWPSGYLYGLP